jgi:glycosyltransferase involved in cell wall biosynthesis
LSVRFFGPAEPEIAAELTARAERAGRARLFEFHGFLDHDALPAALGAASVFALPSTYEPGPGMVYLEAMACGLPVVACSGAGAAEVVDDGVTGFLVPPGDVSALVEVLHRLLSNETERVAMGARARAYATDRASTPEAIERLEALYREVIAHNFEHPETSS